MKKIKKNNEKNSEENSSLIKNVLSRGTIHGFKYLLDEKTTTYEKVFWMFVFTSALIGAACHLQKIWVTYDTHLTRSTIISTYYKYANIPFPSVTVCDSSRVDWQRVEKLSLGEFIKDSENTTAEDEQKLKIDMRRLLAALSIAQFGTPKDLNHVKNVYNSRKLDEIHISEMLLKVVRPCEHVFENKCWWRTGYYNCCDLFELQKTGYGYCYSFNSDISEKSKVLSLNYGLNGDNHDQWTDWSNQIRPRRTAGHGPWTGLRFVVKSQTIPPYVKIKSGIVIIVGDPSGFPFENDLFVTQGLFSNVGISGDAVITTNRLQKLPISKRRCLFANEGRILHRGYLRQNCIANCYRKFVQTSCKCSLDFIYFQIETNDDTKYPPCSVKHLKCLADYNYAFNNHLSEESIKYDKSAQAAPFCECPDDCKNQKYTAKLTARPLDFQDKVLCDVHFERSFCTLYRTDIAFDYLDALVSYGSIAALFLGASLLSVTEILYHISRKVVKIFLEKRNQVKKVNIKDVIMYYRNEFSNYM